MHVKQKKLTVLETVHSIHYWWCYVLTGNPALHDKELLLFLLHLYMFCLLHLSNKSSGGRGKTIKITGASSNIVSVRPV